jgi:alkylglycerol monooxygenase
MRRPGRVAVGACCFMLSDSLLATNKFVAPLPLASFWVLTSYYAAQVLIVGGWLRGQTVAQAGVRPGAESLRFQ